MRNWKKSLVSVIAGSMLLVSCGEAGDGTNADGTLMEIRVEALVDIYPDLSNYDTSNGYFEDIVYGDANAPITIVEYASLICGFCANFHNSVMPRLKEKYIDTGKVKLIYRNQSNGQVDIVAGAVARCEDSETAKKLTDLFFERQRDWYRQGVNPTEELANVARRAGMSRAKFERCALNADMNKFLGDMRLQAFNKLGIVSTPTIYVNGKLVENYFYETLEAAIEAAE